MLTNLCILAATSKRHRKCFVGFPNFGGTTSCDIRDLKDLESKDLSSLGLVGPASSPA